MRAKNEYKFLEEAYTQVNEGIADHVRDAAGGGAVRAEFDPSRHGLEKRYKLKSVGGQHGEQESVVGEFDSIDEVIDFIDLPEEYGSEWTVDIRDNRAWSSEGFQDGLSHFGIGEIFDVVDTQSTVEDGEFEYDDRGYVKNTAAGYEHEDPDKTALGKAFLASQTAEGAPHTGPDDLGPDKSEEQETHKPYISSYMPFHRDEDDKLKPSKKIFAVLDKRGNAIFTSNNKDEAYEWFDDNFKRLRDEDQELPVGHPLHPDEEAKERESRKKFIKSGSNRGPRIRNTKGELGRSKWPERPHG